MFKADSGESILSVISEIDQMLAAFSSASCQDLAAAFCCHSCTEPEFAGAGDNGGMVGSFHV